MWLTFLFGVVALTSAQGPETQAPVNQSDSAIPVWLPVGLQVTDLGQLYTSEKADDEGLATNITGSILRMDNCSAMMDQIMVLPPYMKTELMRALDNETNFVTLVGFMDEENGNFTDNVTNPVNGSSGRDPDFSTDFPDDDVSQNATVMADEVLLDSVHNLYNDEASNMLLQELADSLQGLGAQDLQRAFNTVRMARTYFSYRCRYDCVQGYCGYIARDCSVYGAPCRLRRCHTPCVVCPYQANVCSRRQNLVHGNTRYACNTLSVAPNLYSNNGNLRCQC